MFTKDDLRQLQLKGIDIKTVENQIDNFRRGFPPINLDRPAIVGDGIKVFNGREAKKLSYYYDSNSKKYEVLKFVPASGAASRMFKTVFEFMEQYKGKAADIKSFNEAPEWATVREIIKRLKDFAFYDDLLAVMKKDDYYHLNLLQEIVN